MDYVIESGETHGADFGGFRGRRSQGTAEVDPRAAVEPGRVFAVYYTSDRDQAPWIQQAILSR